MDKQPFEHIENKIRQAAEHVSPPFNEEAWLKMEQLLEQEEGKKPRPVFWWWYFLLPGLLIGFALFYYQNRTADHPHPESLTQDSRLQQETTHSASAGGNQHRPGKRPTTDSLTPDRAATDQRLTDKSTENANRLSAPESTGINTGKHRGRHLLTPKAGTATSALGKEPRNASRKNPAAGTMTASSSDPDGDDKTLKPGNGNLPPELPQSATTLNNISAAPENQAGIASVPGKIISDSLVEPTNKKPATGALPFDSVEATVSGSKRDTKKSLNQRGFYMLIAGGVDAVSLKHLSLHVFRPVYGGSIGYRFSKNLSLQAGFYAGKRLYTAGPGDYEIKTGSYIAKIISADAECIIYDIPLSIRYDILTTKRSNIFVTTGLSSYLLKRETYDMHFYNPSGMYRRMEYTYKNNKNYFSIYNLSLGYEQRISKRLSVLAEPYLKLPLSGVGEGSVKLFSAGIQAGVKIFPFGKSTSHRSAK